MRRGLRIALMILGIVLVCSTTSFVAWAEAPLGPMPEALDALRSDATVSVATAPWLVFTPRSRPPTTGLIFYPGARVDPRAYAPPARAIAAEGYLVVIVPMPLNLALFAPDRAEKVAQAFPAIRRWAIGGHSLGGAMACSFVHDTPGWMRGLALWAAYPQPSDTLAAQGLAVVQIDGTHDGVINRTRLAASKDYLPPDTRQVNIPGGNHGQFGWYGDQPGDNPAAISRVEQQRQVVEATLALLHEADRR
jgi:hypothetical protein